MRVQFFFSACFSRHLSPPLPAVLFRRLSRILLMAAIAGLAACGGGRYPPPPTRGNGILFSPNGEPLSGGPLGRPKCQQAIADWFSRTDRNHDGVIDLDEFLADNQEQFARMDVHHAGYVTAADLSEFRAPYESGPGAMPGGGGDGPSAGGSPGKGPGANGGRNGPRGPLVDTRADPVMSADKSLSFKVTAQDFTAHGREVFAELNASHDGRLTAGQAQTSCKEEDKP